MSRRHVGPPYQPVAKLGETWKLRTNRGQIVTLRLEMYRGYREWVWPDGTLYDRQDTVGLIRKVDE